MKRTTRCRLERPLFEHHTGAPLCWFKGDGHERLLVVVVRLLVDEREGQAARGFHRAEGATDVEGVTFWRPDSEPVVLPFNRVEPKPLGPKTHRPKPLRECPSVDERSKEALRRDREDLLQTEVGAGSRLGAGHAPIMTRAARGADRADGLDLC